MMSFLEFLTEKLGVKHLTPDGKRKSRKEQQQKNNRQIIIQNISKIKDILDDLGYLLKKGDYDHTVRRYRLVALSRRKQWTLPKHAYDKKYISNLFALAHETGHAMQWVGNKEEKFDYFFSLIQNAKSEDERKELKHLEQMFYEIDGWVKGKQFIPRYLLNSYFKEAEISLQTYMKHPLDYYRQFDYLELLMMELKL